MKLAAKLLSAVEVDPSASNQHEFNAGRLRKALAFPPAHTSASLDLIYLGAEGDEPEFETCRFTLYDSREDKPRPAEYRLYFDSTELQLKANEGDILVLIRPSDAPDLTGIVLPPSSGLGSEIRAILGRQGVDLRQLFTEISVLLSRTELAQLLSLSSDPQRIPDRDTFLNASSAGFVADAVSLGLVPRSRTMALEAASVVKRLLRGPQNPDEQLYWALVAETALFQSIEEQIGQRKLDQLARDGAVSFVDATSLVLSQLQSRRTRRGQSLQLHFASLLRDHGIPYGSQCKTEGGETPDFIIPGCVQYDDEQFPGTRLRMVACKSTLKERWGQVLKEAVRVPEKYVLTVDAGLTDQVVHRMVEHKLHVFLPEAILTETYHGRMVRPLLGNVSMLLQRLEGAWLG